MKYLRTVSILVLCLLSFILTEGQELSNKPNTFIRKKNIIDITSGGNGLIVSVNYNRLVLINQSWFMDISAGIGTTTPLINGLTIPHQATLNFGKRNDFLEFGIGGSYWQGKSDISEYKETLTSYNLSPIIGWRKHWKNNLALRIYANPLIHVSGEYYIEDYAVIPYLGISFGYAF
jgi:hypothetical protein